MNGRASNNCEEWRHAIASEAPGMFQIALLLSGNREVAEAALIDSIETLPCHGCLCESAVLAQWAAAIVTESLRTLGVGSTLADNFGDDDPLDPRLRMIMNLPALPRAAFVLKLLLGYSFPRVAALLNISNDKATELLAEGARLLAEHQTAIILVSQTDKSRD
jgi:hypothetical protein